MIRLAIVEDEKAYADTIKEYIERYSEETGVLFQVTHFTDGVEVIDNYKMNYDLILMDIEMEQMDGMKAAERIREKDDEVVLIFITNMTQYAVKGYMVDAMSYLLKPVPYFAFSQEMDRSLKKIRRRNDAFLMVPHRNGMVRVNAKDIIYIESYKHHVIINTTTDERISFVSTMKMMEEKLLSEHFYRCNNGYLVNLSYVLGVEGSEVILSDKRRLPVSRGRKKGFLSALTDYIGEMSL